MQEFNALAELLIMLIKDPRVSLLLILLTIASVSDYRIFKIPNWLTGGGIVLALIYNTAVPFYKDHGFLWALGGLAIGFLVMLPCYVIRVMGAGDVKLMAMVGAFLGVNDILPAILFSLIIGGIAAIGFALFNKVFIRMLANVKSAAQMMMMSAIGGFKPDLQIASGKSVGKLPYGICIAVGTTIFLVTNQLGFKII